MANPFLKWAGGKRGLLPQLEPLLPATWGNYFEPFVGGGAMFFALQEKRPGIRAQLSDLNHELVDCYLAVRDYPKEVIAALQEHVVPAEKAEEHYYAVRAKGTVGFLSERAARTIYLNKMGYNGLYRVNQSGGFNVPWGHAPGRSFIDVEGLMAASAALEHVVIAHEPYKQASERAKLGDLVYFDPPYLPVSKTSDFTAYTKDAFGIVQHCELASHFKRLAGFGVKVMLSNSDMPEIRELYKDFDVQTISAARAINSKGGGRGKVNEIVVRNFSS